MSKRINKLVIERKILLFGFILIITAEWKDFFSESKLFKEIQQSI
jgi:hypothetical protein